MPGWAVLVNTFAIESFESVGTIQRIRYAIVSMFFTVAYDEEDYATLKTPDPQRSDRLV